MEVIGKVKVIFDTETVGTNNFRKRDIVVSTDEQYPQDISIQFVQDKTDLLNLFQIGQDVKISINLRGREWINPQGEAKYFNTIQGWRIESVGASAPPPAQASNVPPAETFQPNSTTPEEEPDDLPF